MKPDFVPIVNEDEKEIIKTYNFYGLEYTVNQFGVVYGRTGKVLTQKLNEDGYPIVFLTGVELNSKGKPMRYYQKVHRIVATCFIEQPISEEKLEVNHIDCDRTNNYYKNLEWVTHNENIQYCIKVGNHKMVKNIGTDNVKSKLTEQDVVFIRKKYKEGMKIRLIYREYYLNKVTETTIENICKRRTWKHID